MNQDVPLSKNGYNRGHPQKPNQETRKGSNTTSTLVSYKDATLSLLKVTIVDKDNPYWITPKGKEDLVKKFLKGKLDKIHLSTPTNDTKSPVFHSWTHSGKIIRVTCEDNYTLDWLTKSVDNQNP